MDLISLLAIANIVLHIGPMLGMFVRSTNMIKFMLVSDVIVALGMLMCCPFTALIWIVCTYVDWKEYGYVFKG